MTTEQSTKKPRAVLPLILLHFAAAAVCFGFFSVVPIVACLILMAVSNDPGGPLFFPMFVLGVILFAAVITGVLAGAAMLSDLVRRRYRVPVWIPPLAVFAVAAGLGWLFFPDANPVLPPIAGGILALAFTVHWAAVSTVWFLPRLLFRIFRVVVRPQGEREGAVPSREGG